MFSLVLCLNAGCSWPQESGVSEAVRTRAAQPPLQQEGVLHLHHPGHIHIGGAVLCPLCYPVWSHSEQRSAPRRLPDLRCHHGDSTGHRGQRTGGVCFPYCPGTIMLRSLFHRGVLTVLFLCMCPPVCRSLWTQASGRSSTMCLCGVLSAATSPSCWPCTVRASSGSFPISSTLSVS